jgi:ubiquinone/menaquinone biosynthesis C-methylase UbiE
MNVQDMMKNWDMWGREDPMYSILADQNKANGGWNEQEFFESGEKQVDRRIRWLRDNGVVLHYGKALDFGCGLGRLTNALAKYFEVVQGVDISQSMVEQARKFCRHPNKIEYIQNTREDLSGFEAGEYDLVYSEIALQHAPTRYQVLYIRDFLRLLSPRGVACFQTTRAIGWRALVPDWAADFYRKQRYKDRAFFPMYPIKPYTIKRLISEADCYLLSYQAGGPEESANRFCGDVYVVARASGNQSVASTASDSQG